MLEKHCVLLIRDRIKSRAAQVYAWDLGHNCLMTWIPFGADSDTHALLVDGTPKWMDNSLRVRFEAEFSRANRSGYSERRVDRMQRMELDTRMRPVANILANKGISAVWISMTEAERLRVFDWTIRDNVSNREGGNDDLERVLRDGGSKWKVGVRNGVPGLEERVPQGVQDAADAAMSVPGDAGRLLSEAWHATYGMNPQPDLGYRKAIESVEAAVLPKVMPNDSTATLGKAIGQIRTDGNWKLPFVKEHAQNPSHEVLLGMLQALWSGHSDRHPGTTAYVQSTQQAAEAAVSLAVALVNLFAGGGVARR